MSQATHVTQDEDPSPPLSDELGKAGENELALLLQSAHAAVAEANAARQTCVDHLHAVQGEIARRKDEKAAADYERRRRAAVANGETPPAPPKAIAATQSPTTRVASTRLAGLSISTTKAQTTLGERNAPVSVSAVEQEPPIETGVSDHAVVRYLERVVGFDIDALRKRILTPTVEAAIRSGVTRIRTAEGVIVARQGMITSYLPRESGPVRRNGGGRIRDHERSDVRPRKDELMRDLD